MSMVRMDVDARTIETRALGPVSIATDTDTDSATVDLAAYPGYRVLVVAASGTRTDGSYTVKVRHSHDDVTYADATVFSGSNAAVSAANTMRVFTVQPVRRYMKIRITSTGTTSGALLTAFVLLVPPAL